MGRYMIKVVGNSEPMKIHEDKEVALQEALRLSKQPKNLGKDVHLMKIRKTFRSRVEVEEIGNETT